MKGLAMKGLRVSVYRAEHLMGADCTNGGVSSKASDLTVVAVEVNGVVSELPLDCQVFAPSESAPAMVLVQSNVPGLYGPHLEPYGPRGDAAERRRIGPMAGGNYAGCSDSRWSVLGEQFGHGRLDVVAVHDRFESPELYRALSSD